jgi:hypothetical protein
MNISIPKPLIMMNPIAAMMKTFLDEHTWERFGKLGLISGHPLPMFFEM